MRIIIDLDNTVLDSYATILKLYEQKMERKALLNSTTVVRDIATYCPGLTAEEVSAFFMTTDFFNQVQPFEGAIEILQQLAEAGHEIIVASLHNQPHEPKRRWVETHLPFVKEIYLIEFDDHHRIDKSQVLGDIMIDDNVLGLTSSPAPHKICFNYYDGYNNHWKGISFNRWDQTFLNYLMSLDEIVSA